MVRMKRSLYGLSWHPLIDTAELSDSVKVLKRFSQQKQKFTSGERERT
ncbi:unnamed protein product [Prunus armeniaca]|uniref:Uncharacterized protein n=1 Tax=Prunus armeniaca TaxID=36596 RepID=A0A6J5TQG9_PRUAR|nr:unnamed protein product [Prunus armeniaca]